MPELYSFAIRRCWGAKLAVALILISPFVLALARNSCAESAPYLVRDLNANLNLDASSFPSQIEVLGEVAYFRARVGTLRAQLWRSDGTTLGTFLVKDVAPDHLTATDTRLFFVANDAENAPELWVSDGTAQGTTLIDIRPDDPSAPVGSAPDHLTPLGGLLFFTADDGVHGRELWRSDGTAGGTHMVKDIKSGAGSGPLPGESRFGVHHGLLYFFANGSGQPLQLWRSDGSEEGTEPFDAARPAFTGSAGDTPILSALDRLWFVGVEPVHRLPVPWISDGTPEGTHILDDADAAEGPSFDFQYTKALVAAGDRVYFPGYTEPYGSELWQSDGTPEGTHIVADLVPGPEPSTPRDLTALDERICFTTATSFPLLPQPAWCADSSGAAPVNVSPGARDLGSGGDLLYFSVLEDACPMLDCDLLLRKSDGTTQGTPLTAGGTPLAFATDFTRFGDGVLFAAQAGFGNELYASNGTDAGTHLVKDIFAPTGYGFASNDIVGLGDHVYFQGNDGSGPQLWSSDGSEAGTQSLIPLGEGTGDGMRASLRAGTKLFFTLNIGAQGVWSSDGTTTGTGRVLAAEPQPTRLVAAGDLVFFRSDHTGTPLLWRSDGSEAGTYSLTELDGIDSLLEGAVGGLYFIRNDDQLWHSDGTEEGTHLVATIGDHVRELRTAGSRVFVTRGRCADGDSDLWVSDGTPEGTDLVRHLCPADGMVAQAGRLFFVAGDGSSSDATQRLWVSDGTAEGTLPLASVDATNLIARPDGVTFFSRREDFSLDVWTTDGSAEGTSIVGRVERGSALSVNIERSLLAQGRAYFIVATAPPSHDFVYTTWVTDGTPDGTGALFVMPSLPYAFGTAGLRLFFPGDTPETAGELWAYDIEPAAISCAGDCGGDGVVTEVEIALGVRLALGDAAAECSAYDAGAVTVDRLVAAVRSRTNGCYGD